MITSEKFLTQLEKMRVNQANYQPVLICSLLPLPNMEADIKYIGEKLFIKNPKGKLSFFQSRACPVYKVLSGKKMIVESLNGWKINTTLTKTQKDQAMKICKTLQK